jgi:hypothetical protein
MKWLGRIALILALALVVCGVAWGVQQFTSGGEAAGGPPAGMAEMVEGQTPPARPDGDFAGREGGPGERAGGLFALIEVGVGFVQIAVIVLVVVLAQRLFARRPRRPAAV